MSYGDDTLMTRSLKTVCLLRILLYVIRVQCMLLLFASTPVFVCCIQLLLVVIINEQNVD